jgi:hypothetical protein
MIQILHASAVFGGRLPKIRVLLAIIREWP